MKLFGDYHTHTTFSHGKGSVLDNAMHAKELGLKQLGIADHGFGHILYGMDKHKLPQLKQEIADATKITGVKVLLGVEANFTSTKGDIDLTPEQITQLDFILVGHHRFVKSSFADKFKFFLPNMILKNKVSDKQVARNTKAICLALEKYPIDALTHLKHDCKINLEEVAKKCVDTNTMIELNNSKMLFTQEEINMMVALGVKFLISSDAHSPEKVGEVQPTIDVVKKYNIPLSQVANLNKVPKFKKGK